MKKFLATIWAAPGVAKGLAAVATGIVAVLATFLPTAYQTYATGVGALAIVAIGKAISAWLGVADVQAQKQLVASALKRDDLIQKGTVRLSLLLAIAGVGIFGLLLAGCQGTVPGAEGKLHVGIDPATGKVNALDIYSNRDTVIQQLTADLATGKLSITGYVGNGSTLGIQGQLPLGMRQSDNATILVQALIDKLVSLIPGAGGGAVVVPPAPAPTPTPVPKAAAPGVTRQEVLALIQAAKLAVPTTQPGK